MSATEFMSGPFSYRPSGRLFHAGKPCLKWALVYGTEEIAEATLPAEAGRSEVSEALAPQRAAWTTIKRAEHDPDLVQLIDYRSDTAVASFYSWGVPEMTAGIINDNSTFWLRSENRLRSRPVTLTEYGHLVRQFAAPERAWVCGLLPDDVLSHDPEEWRPPTAWELRHVVGQGSFTSATGAEAAELVGVSPRNFRKYTASDSAGSRQGISFAMWHALLHRLRVQSLPEG